MTANDELHLTSSEKEAIELLKNRIKDDVDQDILDNTYLLYRFLKARNFNIYQAENMFRKHLQWKNLNGIDKIITDYNPPEALEKYIPYSRCGFDKEGSICRYIPLGVIDAKGIMSSAKNSDILKTVAQSIELDEKLARDRAQIKTGKIPGYVYIINVKDMPFSLATDKKGIELIIRILKMFQDNYPERLKSAYIINVSSYFVLAYTIVKNFVASSIMKKLQLYGSEEWKEELLKIIDADELPKFLGGTKTDPDGNPLCLTIINHGKIVPQCYYLKNNTKLLSADPESKKLFLPRASSSEVHLEVTQPRSLIEWEFETNSKDIAFGVFFKENDTNLVEVFPVQRMGSEEFSEKGIYQCDKIGTYVLLFDNSFSWIRSKEIFYKTAVTIPKIDEIQLTD